MEMVRLYPFPTLIAAIAYYRFSNPARQKFVNILDQEPRSHDKKPDFSGESPADIWSSVCRAIEKVHAATRPIEWEAFRLYYLDEDLAWKLGAEDIAKHLSISPKRVYRFLADTKEELEKELIRRELLKPPPESAN